MSKKIILALLLALSSNAYSKPETTLMDQVADLTFYRPAGFFTTLVSSGVFLVTLPMTIVTSVFPPHDQVVDSLDDFVIEQFQNTFTRPLGEKK